MPEAPPVLEATFYLRTSEGVELPFRRPVVYRWVDRARGERSRDLQIVPGVAVSFAQANSGELDMHFLTEVRNGIPGLPVIPIISQAATLFGKHWMHVSVTGSLHQQTRVRTEPRPPAVLTDPFQSVMEALGAGELLQPPRRSPMPQGLAPRRRPGTARNPT